MNEFVGNCSVCGRAIHCHDGFLNGIVNEDKTISCFDCREKHEGQADKSKANEV